MIQAVRVGRPSCCVSVLLLTAVGALPGSRRLSCNQTAFLLQGPTQTATKNTPQRRSQPAISTTRGTFESFRDSATQSTERTPRNSDISWLIQPPRLCPIALMEAGWRSYFAPTHANLQRTSIIVPFAIGAHSIGAGAFPEVITFPFPILPEKKVMYIVRLRAALQSYSPSTWADMYGGNDPSC